jgi:hypothetical protein
MTKETNSTNETIKLLSDEDAKKYAGQHVCVENYNSKVVISANYNPGKAIKAAQKKGYEHPVTFYVPRPDEIFIFSCAA